MKLPPADERLRQESPAYRPDDDWEVLEPQGMSVVLSVRFDAPTAQRLAAVARAAGRVPSVLIRDWTVERLASLGSEPQKVTASQIREAAGGYLPDGEEDERLRTTRYRPAKLQTLLVGESRPAGGRFFYRANSNLFYATRQAFQVAYGRVPDGAQFLAYLQQHGFWLYDIADRPVDRMRGRPRHDAVHARAFALVELLRASRPAVVIAIKKNLGATVRQAMTEAGLSVDRLHVLPFPLYQWRRHYIFGLASLLRAEGSQERTQADSSRPRSVAEEKEGETQRVTRVDLRNGRIRFPARSKALMPASKTTFEIDLRGHRIEGRYDPRNGPDRPRSGVLLIARPILTETVAPDEVLSFIRTGNSIRLW
jgi:hypothetical protein